MRLRNWLLTGTSLGMIALAPISMAWAQDTELTLAYQAYITAQQSGDATAIAAAQVTLQEQCIVAGFPTLDDCIVALTAQTGVAPMAPPMEQAPAGSAPAEAPPAEQPAAETPPAEQPAAETPPAEQPAAEPAPAEQAPAVEPAPADVSADLALAVAEYNAGVTLIEQGNADAGNQQIAAAQAKIAELCTTAGFPDVNACLVNFGLMLNPLPAAPAEAAPEATPPAAEPAPATAPEATPAAAEPAPTAAPEAAPETAPAAAESAPLANPEEEQLKQLIQAVDDYNAGVTLIDQGNTDQGKPQTDAAMAKITELCAAAGYPDVTICLDTFGLTLNPLPGEPAAPAAETPPPPAVDEAAANAAVTPEATEVLPETVAPEEAAPILDSSKDEQTLVESGEAPAEPAPPVAEDAPAPAPAPASDQDAQAQITPPAPDQQSVEAEQGTKVADFVFVEPTATENAPVQVVQKVDNAFIFQINFQLVINNPQQERDRIYDQDEDQIYYEELSHGRVRETIIRPNGVRIVTIRNRYGDVLKRSRFTPDGREYILAAYNEDQGDGDFIVWRDPGDDLPPLRLTIPAREYILDADYADEEEVEDFFRQPPVEQVRRIYSVEEVKRSARIRDTVRRLEVGGLTFDSGKATISRDQVASLSKVAKAMLRLLDANPAETFLIEGHTDAVGSDISNLALSDNRAATIARILSDFYDIPAENLVTQGYGERYLKVKTQEAERLNRRATIKRITPLVTYTGSN